MPPTDLSQIRSNFQEGMTFVEYQYKNIGFILRLSQSETGVWGEVFAEYNFPFPTNLVNKVSPRISYLVYENHLETLIGRYKSVIFYADTLRFSSFGSKDEVINLMLSSLQYSDVEKRELNMNNGLFWATCELPISFDTLGLGRYIQHLDITKQGNGVAIKTSPHYSLTSRFGEPLFLALDLVGHEGDITYFGGLIQKIIPSKIRYLGKNK
jgi:hypothetical protein